MIKSGIHNILNAKVGSYQVHRIYLGADIVWEPSTGETHSILLYTSTNGQIITPATASTEPSVLSNTYINGQGKIEYDGTLTEIIQRKFLNNDYLRSVIIPDTVTSIGMFAFAYCHNLNSIVIPDSVTSIGISAFGNTAISSVVIPASVISAGGAFDSCRSLTSITLLNSKIDSSMFSYCTSLVSVNIPRNITSIGYAAFNNCTSLRSIEIPDTVTEIAGDTFQYCTALTAVTIPNSVTGIFNESFRNCTSLSSITIPNSVNVIAAGAFMGCTSLSNFRFNGTKSQWANVEKYTNWKKDCPFTVVHCTDGDVAV